MVSCFDRDHSLTKQPFFLSLASVSTHKIVTEKILVSINTCDSALLKRIYKQTVFPNLDVMSRFHTIASPIISHHLCQTASGAFDRPAEEHGFAHVVLLDGLFQVTGTEGCVKARILIRKPSLWDLSLAPARWREEPPRWEGSSPTNSPTNRGIRLHPWPRLNQSGSRIPASIRLVSPTGGPGTASSHLHLIVIPQSNSISTAAVMTRLDFSQTDYT